MSSIREQVAALNFSSHKGLRLGIYKVNPFGTTWMSGTSPSEKVCPELSK